MTAMRAALAVAAERVEPMLREIAAAGRLLTPTLVQLARAAALVAAYDAQPRHRELPDRADTIEWLDRHCGEPNVLTVDDQVWEMNRAAARRFEVSPQEWYGTWPPDLDRPGAGGRYSHTGGWAGNWRVSGG